MTHYRDKNAYWNLILIISVPVQLFISQLHIINSIMLLIEDSWKILSAWQVMEKKVEEKKGKNGSEGLLNDVV